MLSSAANVWINNKRKAVEACFCGSADDACCQRQQLVGVRKKEGEENVAAVEAPVTRGVRRGGQTITKDHFD